MIEARGLQDIKPGSIDRLARNRRHHSTVEPISGQTKQHTYKTRNLEIQQMKLYAVFLGRTTETGQSFDTSFWSQQCCYVCQSMMGYQTPACFSGKRVKKHLCQFKWEPRENYAISCAKIAVSL